MRPSSNRYHIRDLFALMGVPLTDQAYWSRRSRPQSEGAVTPPTARDILHRRERPTITPAMLTAYHKGRAAARRMAKRLLVLARQAKRAQRAASHPKSPIPA